MPFEQLGEGLRAQERNVPVRDQHGAGDHADLFEHGADRVAGATLLTLDDGARVGTGGGQMAADLLQRVADDDDQLLGTEVPGGCEHMVDQRTAT